MGQGVVIRIGTSLVQTLLDVGLGLGTQPCYKTLGDLQVKKVQT